ncbi:hypothetical protein ACRAWD_04005 [Caulobacter segnis]
MLLDRARPGPQRGRRHELGAPSRRIVRTPPSPAAAAPPDDPILERLRRGAAFAPEGASHGQRLLLVRTLVTSDTAAAGAFYKAVIGWTSEMSSGPAGPYTIFKTGAGIPVGGMLRCRASRRAGWAMVAVDDVDCLRPARSRPTAARSTRPCRTFPDVGRFARRRRPAGRDVRAVQGRLDRVAAASCADVRPARWAGRATRADWGEGLRLLMPTCSAG